MNLMIVEDDPQLLAEYRKHWSRKNHRVFGFTNARDALWFYDSFDGKIDLVITDLNLPKKSGEALVFDIKYLNPWQKIVVFSGFPDACRLPPQFSVKVYDKSTSFSQLLAE